MKGLQITIVMLLATLCLSSCATGPSATLFGPRSIILGAETYSEEILGKFTSWQCKDYVEYTGTLVEVGSFDNPKLEGLGFILYDGSDSGELTNYQRKGINHRWDWGPNGSDYAFVINPDGTGLFYDFSSAPEGELVKANGVYKCSR